MQLAKPDPVVYGPVQKTSNSTTRGWLKYLMASLVQIVQRQFPVAVCN